MSSCGIPYVAQKIYSVSYTTEPVLGVFVQNIGSQAQFYTMGGKWLHKTNRSVIFTVPNFFSRQDLDPIRSYLPSQQIEIDMLNKLHPMDASVPRAVAAHILTKLHSFQIKANQIFREYAERLDQAHNLIGHATEMRFVSLQEITMTLLGKQDPSQLTNEMLWAVHKALRRKEAFKTLGEPHRLSKVWEVKPLDLTKELQDVKNWMRDHTENAIASAMSPEDTKSLKGPSTDTSHPVEKFVRKARRLIESSRTLRSPTRSGTLSPSSAKVEPSKTESGATYSIKSLTTFTGPERAIISYLEAWCVTWSLHNSGTLASFGPMILRAVGMYEGFDLDRHTGFVFLQELGVVAPWEARATYEVRLGLPSYHNPHAKRLREINEKSVAVILDRSQGLVDSLQSLRKDWGNMTVYCIDDASAMEIDDGVSLESINESSTEYWVHVHIANPSAFIQPESPLAKFAEYMQQSLYLPDMVYPMLSSSLTQQRFSLAKDRPTLTISAKLTMEGTILSTKIAAGIARNVKRLTPSQLSEALGLDQDQDLPRLGRHVYTVGGQFPRSQDTDPASVHLSPSEVAELRTLHKLVTARHKIRQSTSQVIELERGYVAEPYVYLQRGGLGSTYNPFYGRRINGDPIISWEAQETDRAGMIPSNGSNNMVRDLMLLAGEVAAQWCSERNIPSVYRGTIQDPEAPITPQDFKAKIIDPAQQKEGFVSLFMRSAYGRLIGITTLSSTPTPHANLGTKGYVKATSPLRRYLDMIVHWQIQAALLEEARTGTSLVGSTDESHLPFSRAQIDALIPAFLKRERALTTCSRRARDHWIFQLLFRAFYFREAILPETFDLFVYAEQGQLSIGTGAMGSLKQLSGFGAVVNENAVTRREGGVLLGDWWEVKMGYVDCYKSRMYVEPVRLVERNEYGGQTKKYWY